MSYHAMTTLGPSFKYRGKFSGFFAATMPAFAHSSLNKCGNVHNSKHVYGGACSENRAIIVTRDVQKRAVIPIFGLFLQGFVQYLRKMHPQTPLKMTRWIAAVAALLWMTTMCGCRSYDTALLAAVRAQEVGNVQRLLDGGAVADQVPAGETMFPLEAAAIGGNADIVRMLLQHGAHPDSARGGESPLWLALQHDHAEAAVLLVDAGARFDGPMRRGMMPFYCAVMLDHGDLVTKMVAHGADLSAPGPQGSPLHEAADNGNLALVKLLVANGADINRINDLGETPIFLAAQRRNWELVAWIAAHGGQTDATNNLGNTPLHEFAAADDSAAIRQYCALATDPDVHNKIGETPLHVAAAKGNLAAALALLDACFADINPRDGHGLSPAGLAYREGESDMVELLTQRGGRLR
jgi:ankyrin repeat protein